MSEHDVNADGQEAPLADEMILRAAEAAIAFGDDLSASSLDPATGEASRRLSRRLSELPAFLGPESLSRALAELGPIVGDHGFDAFAGHQPGGVVGPYRLVERIGIGGMGEVFRAERIDGSFRQTVALKVLRNAALREGSLDRFRQERQVLADLVHPHIARLLDGGSDEDGRPYIVMELIEGVRITDAVRTHGLSTERLAALLVQACEAIEAAHRRMIVHCDIKPANLLVTASGSGGALEVRLLDFGIAQLLTDGERERDGVEARSEMDLRWSARYASPEQMRGERPTAAWDVHALGVVLSEALAKTHPTGGGDRADLEAIARKASAREPSDRYASVEAMRRDLLRWLENEPVIASPVPFGRRVELFVRRHRTAVAVSAFVAIGLGVAIAAIVAAFFATANARDAERIAASEAREQSVIADGTARFLREILASVDPSVALGRDTTLIVEMLDRAAERLASDDELPPKAHATLSLTLGASYRAIAQYAAAERHLSSALAAMRSLDADAEEIARAVQELASLCVDTDRFDRAEMLFREAQELRLSISASHPGIGEAWRGLAQTYRDLGRYDESERAGLEAIRADREGGTVTSLIGSLLERGVLLTWIERPDEAIPVIEEALAVAQEAFGERHPTLAQARYARAFAHRRRGDLDAAIRDYRAVLELRRELLHDRHPDIASTMNMLAAALEQSGVRDEAETLYREAIARMRAALGDRHMDVATAENNLAGLLRDRGELAEARAMYEGVISVYRTSLGNDHIWNAIVAENLARTAELAGDWSAGLAWIDEAIRIRERANDPRHRLRILQGSATRARCLVESDPVAASLLARSVWEELRSLTDVAHPARLFAKPRVVEVLRRAGHPAEADRIAAE